MTRRRAFVVTAAAATVVAAARISSVPAALAENQLPDTLDIPSFLKYGQVSNPMGVSGQAGKSRPETGIVFREGSEVSRDSRSGDVLAEILLGSTSSNPIPVLASFSSPWPLAKGTVFDVECRDGNTGDGAFLAVTGPAPSGKSVMELSSDFLLDRLFSPTGRFSFYGSPTDVKVKKSYLVKKKEDDYRVMELTFSNLSQSTSAEIPRTAILVATIPRNSPNNEAVMLVGSANSSRWRNGGSEASVRKTVESFRAIPAPTGGMKIRAKERTNTNI